MSALTLTGAIPGLLRRGSPVWWRDEETPFVVTCGCVDTDDATWTIAAPCAGITLGVQDDPSNFTLNLTDPTGRYHALLWLRERGHDMRWAEDEAEALAWSVLSVARGGKPIAVILDNWNKTTGFKRARRLGFLDDVRIESNVGEECFYGRHDYRKGWRLYRDDLGTIGSGPETGDAGKAAADAAGVAAGYALRNPDGSLTLPELPKENA